MTRRNPGSCIPRIVRECENECYLFLMEPFTGIVYPPRVTDDPLACRTDGLRADNELLAEP